MANMGVNERRRWLLCIPWIAFGLALTYGEYQFLTLNAQVLEQRKQLVERRQWMLKLTTHIEKMNADRLRTWEKLKTLQPEIELPVIERAPQPPRLPEKYKR